MQSRRLSLLPGAPLPAAHPSIKSPPAARATAADVKSQCGPPFTGHRAGWEKGKGGYDDTRPSTAPLVGGQGTGTGRTAGVKGKLGLPPYRGDVGMQGAVKGGKGKASYQGGPWRPPGPAWLGLGELEGRFWTYCMYSMPGV